jgi:flavin reductase (DIM6/NTAB) family NADH-FMN oxidoreductase RutF
LRRQQNVGEKEVAATVEGKDENLLDRLEEEGYEVQDGSRVGVTPEVSGRGVQEANTTKQAYLGDGAILKDQENLVREPSTDGERLLDQRTIKELVEQHEQELDENAGPAALQQSVRHIMRHVPSSVAVITAACIDPESNSQIPLGIAVSSFSTVTLDPPTVSFNVRYPSRTLDAIKAANGRFRVHFLDSEPHGAAIADLFTKGNYQQAFQKRLQATKITLPTSPFPPRILDAAVVAALECKVIQEFTVADHVIVVAKVSDTRGKNITKPTLSYVQGDYVRKDGAAPRTHKEANSPTRSRHLIKSHPFFSFAPFPGEPERDTFIGRIETYLEQNPEIFRFTLRQAEIEVRYNLNLRGGTLGVSLTQVIAEVAARKGLQMKMEPWQRDLPIKYNFYGSLSPSDISSIVDSVKQLVQGDLTYLSLNQEKLFLLLGIDPRSTGMLASDILNPLRDEKLIPPFDYANFSVRPKGGGEEWERKSVIPDLEQLEWVEHQLRKYLQTQEYGSATRLSPEELAQNAIGEKGWVKTYISYIQARLYVEAFPEQFGASKIDVSGQLSKVETRFVLRRIFSFLAQDRYHNIKDHLALPWWEILRRVNVHPLISGFDIEFLYYKLKYFLSSGPDLKQIREYILSLEKPWFKLQVEMAELEALVEDFAENYPLQAIKWKRKDWLAAMGLSHMVRVLDPTTSDLTALVTGHTMPRLVNAALEKRYGVGKDREMEAVVKYLQDYETRNFTSQAGIHFKKTYVEPRPARHAPVSLRYEGLMSDAPESLSVIRKHAAAQLLSPEQQQVAESIKSKMAKRNPVSDLEYKHLNFAEELLDLAGKSHGFKAYGLDGERKK